MVWIMRAISLLVLSLVLLPFAQPNAYAQTLKTAEPFAVLAGSTVTNAAYPTIINGDLGVSPGVAVTGFPPGIVSGTILTNDAAVGEAKIDLTSAFTTEGGLGATGGYPAGDLSGLTLGPGVYTVPATTSNLAGTLTLTDHGVAGSIFVFQMSSTLITSSNSMINVSGLSPSDSLFWVVGSSATLGDNTVFDGNILALTDISFDPGATVDCGRALARNGQVTFAGQNPTSLIQNQVSIGCVGTAGAGGGGFNGSIIGSGGGGGTGTVATPEPGTMLLLGSGLVVGLVGKAGIRRRAKARRA